VLGLSIALLSEIHYSRIPSPYEGDSDAYPVGG
jgi:hypothetical protein